MGLHRSQGGWQDAQELDVLSLLVIRLLNLVYLIPVNDLA